MKAIYTASAGSLALIMALAAGPVLAAGEYDQSGTSQQQSGMTGSGMSGSNASFSDLDQNGDGQISKQEAQNAPGGGDQLTKNWQSYDANQNDQLDRGEFAAFEAQQRAGRPGMGMERQGQGSQPGAQQQQGGANY